MESIESAGFPLAFKARGGEALYDWPQASEATAPVRVLAGALAGMQKLALVRDSASEAVWALFCDEGPYLNGTDLAPFPLAFFTTGLVLSYLSEIEALARRRGIALRDVTLVQDNRYSMEGSAIRGTMTGGALPVDLTLHAGSDAGHAALVGLLGDAVMASPGNALLRDVFDSRFTITHNDGPLAPERVAALDEAPLPAPDPALEAVRPDPDAGQPHPVIEKCEAAASVFGVEGGAGSSLEAEQKRHLHVRGIATRRGDGLLTVKTQLFKPIGSVFRFLGDLPARYGGEDRAPSPMAYLAAGIAFCYMTQIGRYAQITKRRLESYSVVQDTRFSDLMASAGHDRPAAAAPVLTHVHIRSPEDAETVRTIVDMGEQTCFLHAACRTPLKTRVRVRPPLAETHA